MSPEELDDILVQAVMDYARKYPEAPEYELSKDGSYSYDVVVRQQEFFTLFGAYSLVNQLDTRPLTPIEVYRKLFIDVAAARAVLKEGLTT